MYAKDGFLLKATPQETNVMKVHLTNNTFENIKRGLIIPKQNASSGISIG
jgi:hypothetical protein